MKISKKIKRWLQERTEKRFWSHPDEWFVAVILDENGAKTHGSVKNGLTIMTRIPKPETGYSYLDIVKVEGPTGKTTFRCDEINEYKAIGIHKKSNIPTFIFKYIIPELKDSCDLRYWFVKNNQEIEFLWYPKSNDKEWRKGYCTAENLDQANTIFNSFLNPDSSIQIKDIEYWEYYKEQMD